MLDTLTSTPVAAVVTETAWQKVLNQATIARARKNKPEPIMGTVSYRTAHATESCSRIVPEQIVARNVPLDGDAGLPCEWCFEDELAGGSGRITDRAEIAAEAQDTAHAPAPGTVRRPSAQRTNQYAGRCHKCGAWIEAEAGLLVKANGSWAVEHQGSCPDGTRHQEPATAAPAPADANLRPNRYAGICSVCRGEVGEGQGVLAGGPGNWSVRHRTDQCVQSQEPAVVLADVPTGHYAIVSTGDNDLVFYRVDRPTDGAYAGRVFVKMIVGGHPDSNVKRANVAGILTRIAAAGVEESARLYGQEIGRCCRCNRSLTDQESRRLGIGPECRTKVTF